MNILLSFGPFILFAVLVRLGDVPFALIAAAALSGLLILRERRRGNSVKILEAGTVLLFGGLAIFTAITHYDWTILEGRLAVDLGLLVIVLGSIIARRPFTLQFAREEVPREYWANAQFVATNYRISAAWPLAFVVLVFADIVMAFYPAIPLWIGIAVTILALAGAVWFTRWYPQRVRRRFAPTSTRPARKAEQTSNPLS
jgi:intracellular septation protein A